MEIKIDQDFRSLIPEISSEELKGLEESLLSEGCRDALVLWDDIMLDGHNRYEICQKHEINFKTISKGFDNRDQAKLWIIKNQFSRRNLNDFQRAELALKLKPLLAAQAKERMVSGKKIDPIHNSGQGKTDKEIAKIAGVSHDTINRVEFILENALPAHISYIDIDCCEYCRFCKSPLALIETARDVGQEFKATTIMKNLALKTNIEAWLVLYKLDEAGKIIMFHVKQIHPFYDQFLKMDVSAWGKKLVDLHDNCSCHWNQERKGNTPSVTDRRS